MNTLLNLNAWLFVLVLTSTAAPAHSPKRMDPVKEDACVFVSTDHGVTWSQNDTGFPANDGVNALVVHNNHVFAGTDSHGIWQMDKNGWAVQSKGLPKAARVLSLLSHNQVLFAGLYNAGLYYSTNEGLSWQLLGADPIANVRALNSFNGVVYAGTNDGIYKVNIHAGWTQVLEGRQINGFTSNDQYIYAGTQKGAVRSSDGIVWDPIFNAGAVHQVALTEKDILLSLYSGNVFRASQDQLIFIKEDYFLPHPRYFQLTPASPKIMGGDWSDLPFMKPGTRRGLPADKPFGNLIRTPFGLMATKSPMTGC